MMPFTTSSGLRIGSAWQPIPMPRELTYEELWAQRLLIGGGVRHRHGIDWPFWFVMGVIALLFIGGMAR